MRVNVAFAADHAGWTLRERILRQIALLGHSIEDCGPSLLEAGDDYPDRAEAVAHAIASGRADRGVLVCGSGDSTAADSNGGTTCP